MIIVLCKIFKFDKLPNESGNFFNLLCPKYNCSKFNKLLPNDSGKFIKLLRIIDKCLSFLRFSKILGNSIPDLRHNHNLLHNSLPLLVPFRLN